MDYRDRHVVVTGGTGALGRAVVGALLAAGAHCPVPYRQEPEKEGLPTGALSLIPVPSLADEAAVTKLYGGLPSIWASIHVAGGLRLRPADRYQRGAAAPVDRRQSRELLPLLPRGGGGDAPGKADGRPGGRIVNVAARQALEPSDGAKMSAATAAKAGVAALSAALGKELAVEGILVNAVAPSIMDTPANRRDMPKANFAAWPKVEEVAATILFLASPENKVSRGGVVPVFGASSQSAAS